MIDIFTYKIVYFLIALILGFLLGYLLKKNSYEKKIEKEVENREKSYDSSSTDLKETNKQLIESENRHKINIDLVTTQQSVISKIDDEIFTTKQKIVNLEEAKVELTTKLEDSQVELESYKQKISLLKPQYEDAESDTTKHESLKKKKESILKQLDISNSDLTTLAETIKKQNILYRDAEANLVAKDSDIILLNTKYEKLINKKTINKNINKSELEAMEKDLRIKVLNYKYEIEDLKNNLANGKKIDSTYVDKFISKNEQERFIDKVINKIFNIKSKKAK